MNPEWWRLFSAESPPDTAMTSEFWRSVGEALHADAPPDAVAAMLRAAADQPVPMRRRPVRVAWQLLLAQTRLVRLSVWTASALVMALGVLPMVITTAHGLPETVLALIAPFVAAAGIAGVCGPEPELVAATVISPRVVLVARVALVFAYDLVLALAASLVLVACGLDSSGLGALIGAWLGPMAFLSSLCLLLGVAIGTTPAITVGLALWVTRMLAPVLATNRAWLRPIAHAVTSLWSTNLVTCLLAVVLLGVAVSLAQNPVAA